MVHLDISILAIDFVSLLFYAGEVFVVSFIVPSFQLVRGISLFHSSPISFCLMVGFCYSFYALISR